MIYLKIDSGGSESVAAEEISPGTYQLLENPIFNCLINYGTVVNVVVKEDGKIVANKVVRASKYITRRFLLSDTTDLNKLKSNFEKPLVNAGGTWELAMGGMLFINIPRESGFDIDVLFSESNFFPTEIIEK